MELLTSRDMQRLLRSIHDISSLCDLEAFSHRSPKVLEELVPSKASVIIAADQTVTLNPGLLVYGEKQIGFGLHSQPSNAYSGKRYFAYYVLYHQQQCFSRRDRLLLNLFRPHLNRAFQMALHCDQQQQVIAQLQQSLDQTGVIFLDQLGNVQRVTARARQWLQKYLPDLPVSEEHQLPEQLQTWVQECLAHDVLVVSLPLQFKQGDRQLIVRLVKDPVQKNHILHLMEEQFLSLAIALEQLGLSPRETQILAEIIKGRNPKEIAYNLQIRVNTVRKHLENLYRKLHVQSQTEAVALVLEKLGGNFQV